MANIVVVFSKSTAKLGLFSKLIMLTEKTPYSHVAIGMSDDETGQVVYYQASHTIVNEMAEAEFLAQEKIIYNFEFDVSDSIKHAAKAFAISNLGKPYGAASILGLAFVQICSWLGIKTHNPFRDAGETYVCDQFVAALLENVTNIKFPMDINDMTPKDLYPLIKSLPRALT